MKKSYYSVIATYLQDTKYRASEKVIVGGERDLSCLVNDFVSRKLKDLNLEIKKLTNEKDRYNL